MNYFKIYDLKIYLNRLKNQYVKLKICLLEYSTLKIMDSTNL